jgi:hypothetical protein
MAANLDGAICLLRSEEFFVRFVQPVYHSVFDSALMRQDLLTQAINLRLPLVVSRFALR